MLEHSVENVFAEVDPIIRSALDGHNVCILAYGQTGTGKTYTMVSYLDLLGICDIVMKSTYRNDLGVFLVFFRRESQSLQGSFLVFFRSFITFPLQIARVHLHFRLVCSKSIWAV